MKAVKDKDALQKIIDSWFASSKNLWKLIDCGMSSTVKIGLGYGIKSNAEVLGYEEEISRDGELGAVSDASSTHYSTCQSNDSDGELGTVSDHSVNDDPIHDHIPTFLMQVTSFATQKTQPQDCDYYEKKMAREAALKSKRVLHAEFRQATPAWTNTNRVNKANQFTPRPVQLRPNLSTVSRTVKTGRVNVNTGHANVSSGSVSVNSGTQIKSGASRFNTGKQYVNSVSVQVNSGTQIKSGASRFNTGKQTWGGGGVASFGRVTETSINNTSLNLLRIITEALGA
ncbi:hypothetical protein Tco_0418914 [Tanacetum coccineum]